MVGHKTVKRERLLLQQALQILYTHSKYTYSAHARKHTKLQEAERRRGEVMHEGSGVWGWGGGGARSERWCAHTHTP